ncbi:MAG: hypothetical protein CVU39_14065 [Chloroflexi bacterium HGW-Chloroflexi-10]|nr:MAG: hypothetical protein CVU39_14065 [Chloroflexi bacterium HGW-Chloroflexi-10]
MDTHFYVFRQYLNKLQLEEAIINEVLAAFVVKQYQKGECFSFVGNVEDKLGFVINGLFFMYIDDKNGKTFTKDFLTNKRFLLATFDPDQGSLATIRAIKNSVILEARYSDIQRLFVRYSAFESLSRKRMEKEVEAIYERLESFAGMEAKERYLLFKDKYGVIEEEIPQYLIASYIGVTPTQLSRIRKKL